MARADLLVDTPSKFVRAQTWSPASVTTLLLCRFAVVIVPTYVDPADSASNPFRSTSTFAVDQDQEARDEEHRRGEGERKNSWRWFHTINRVCSGVKKVRARFLSSSSD